MYVMCDKQQTSSDTATMTSNDSNDYLDPLVVGSTLDGWPWGFCEWV